MGRCESCNRPLRSPRSTELGFGPGCWSRLEPTQRAAVLATLDDAGATRIATAPAGGLPTSRPRPSAASTAPATSTVPEVRTAPPAAPRRPQRSNSVLAVLTSWAVPLLLALLLVLYWQWLLLGLGLVAGLATIGLLLEYVQEGRPVGDARHARPRRTRRPATTLTATPPRTMAARAAPTTPRRA